MLQFLFTSKARVKLLEYFFLHPGETFYVRHLATVIDEQTGSVGRELINLEKASILVSKKIGNQKHYSLNENCPILDDLRNIFIKSSKLTQEVLHILESLPNIELAFIYGSFAKGDIHQASDLDIMIVTNQDDTKIAVAIAKIERKFKREINYTLYAREQIQKKMGGPGDFLYEVFSSERINLIGDENDELFRLD